MAKLINKKTGKEFNAKDPDKILKRYPKTFRKKPPTKINNEIAKKEAELVGPNGIEVKDSETLQPKQPSTKKDKKD